jgi:hypothetical protein
LLSKLNTASGDALGDADSVADALALADAESDGVAVSLGEADSVGDALALAEAEALAPGVAPFSSTTAMPEKFEDQPVVALETSTKGKLLLAKKT